MSTEIVDGIQCRWTLSTKFVDEIRWRNRRYTSSNCVRRIPSTGVVDACRQFSCSGRVVTGRGDMLEVYVFRHSLSTSHFSFRIANLPFPTFHFLLSTFYVFDVLPHGSGKWSWTFRLPLCIQNRPLFISNIRLSTFHVPRFHSHIRFPHSPHPMLSRKSGMTLKLFTNSVQGRYSDSDGIRRSSTHDRVVDAGIRSTEFVDHVHRFHRNRWTCSTNSMESSTNFQNRRRFHRFHRIFIDPAHVG